MSSESAPSHLHLIEILAGESDQDGSALQSRVEALLRELGAETTESVWAKGLGRLYVVAERVDPPRLRKSLEQAGLRTAEIAPVRRIGAAADAQAPKPSHLVEWDLPPDLGLERYLARKAEKTPLYANVPEVRFLRTYVREDAVKCLCLYEAPDEDAVRRARAAVSAPISRIDHLDE